MHDLCAYVLAHHSRPSSATCAFAKQFNIRWLHCESLLTHMKARQIDAIDRVVDVRDRPRTSIVTSLTVIANMITALAMEVDAGRHRRRFKLG